MDNYSYSSIGGYSDSVQSSPRSTFDGEDTQSPHNYKIKLMCSYGGTIQPRHHDNQLTYVAGDTKIFAVDRNIKFSLFLSKLSSLSHCQPNDVCFKYQLPGEDLDALISVTNDEDLEHMMLEYDRLFRASVKPVRLRLFLFPVNPPPPVPSSDRQWFVDALNSAQDTNRHDSSSSPAPTTPDFLFGFDTGGHAPPCKVQETVPAQNVADTFGDAEIQRQIHDLERMKLSNQEHLNLRDGYYGQKMTENAQQPVNIPATYWEERYVNNAGVYQQPAGDEQPYYVMPPTASAGVYQTQVMQPVTGQVGQGYYGVQRMVPEVYREQQVFNVVPQQQRSLQQKNTGPYVVGPGVGQVAEHGYGHVGYDATGRQVYYTMAAGGAMQQQFQAVKGRPGGGENQEGS